MKTPITDSPFLDLLPELDGVDSSAVLLSVSDYSDWPACFAANPLALDFILDGDDFSSWGDMEITSGPGAATRRRTIRGQAGSIVKRFNVTVDNWIITEVEFPGITLNCALYICNNVCVDRCTIIDGEADYALRVRGCNDVTIQRCLIGNFKPTGYDIVGIQLKPIYDTSPCFNNRILDCEIYDIVDSIQVSWSGTGPLQTVPVQFTIDGNDCYTTPEYTGQVENGIDIKVCDPNVRSVVSNNRIWGFPGSANSSGDGIVLHFEATNCDVNNNFIGESKNGIQIGIWADNRADTRDIALSGNVIYGCETALNPLNDSVISDTTITKCDSVFHEGPPLPRVLNPRLNNTKIRGTPSAHTIQDVTRAPYDIAVNSLENPDSLICYQRKRLTSKEWVTLSDVITHSFEVERGSLQ